MDAGNIHSFPLDGTFGTFETHETAAFGSLFPHLFKTKLHGMCMHMGGWDGALLW